MKKFFHRFNISTFISFLLVSISWVSASDIIEVAPLTQNILMLRFSDGKVKHHTIGQTSDKDTVTRDPVDTSLIQKTSSYVLKCSSDADFGTAGKSPTVVYRKSKMWEWSQLCTNWDGYNCSKAGAADHVRNHWVFLVLPASMKTGKTYTLSTGTLAKNNTSFSLTFNETTARSEAVHVNNVGYAPGSTAKYGYLYAWMGDGSGLDLTSFVGKPFSLCNATTGSIAFNGTVTLRNGDPNRIESAQGYQTLNNCYTGSAVWECNFSSFSTPGTYVLSVPGIGCSFPFVINDNAYWEPFLWTFKGCTQNRSGIALSTSWADMNRPAPHNPLVTPGFSNRLFYTTYRCFDGPLEGDIKVAYESGKKGNLTQSWGWYQDAGDWDAYPSHYAMPMWLLFLYISNRTQWSSDHLNIPESGNNIPDVLDESMWLPRYYYRVRHEIMTKEWGTGGVGGARTCGDGWGTDAGPGGVLRGSWQDTDRDWYVSGEDPWTTYRYAGFAAIIAMELQQLGKIDPLGMDWATEATQAYAWAKNNTKTGDAAGSVGIDIQWCRAYADAALYGLTNDTTYRHDLKTVVAGYGWNSGSQPDAGPLEAAWMYLFLPTLKQNTDVAMRDLFRSVVKNKADFILNFGSLDARAMRWSGNFWQPLNVGQSTTPMIMEGVLGAMLVGTWDAATANSYIPKIYTTADYFLGTNPLNMCWITGVGARSPGAIFHLDSWSIKGYTNPRKGFVPYGAWSPYDYLGPLGTWNPQLWMENAYPPARVKTSDTTWSAGWPMHEAWCEAGTAPMGGENTTEQNEVPSALTYGFLWGLTGHIGSVAAMQHSGPGTSVVQLSQILLPYVDFRDGTVRVSHLSKAIRLDIFNVSGQLLLTISGEEGTICRQLGGSAKVAVVRIATENSSIHYPVNRVVFR